MKNPRAVIWKSVFYRSLKLMVLIFKNLKDKDWRNEEKTIKRTNLDCIWVRRIMKNYNIWNNKITTYYQGKTQPKTKQLYN